MQEILEHLLERQVSPQWRGFLEALAGEFSDQLDQDELRQLMARVGVRFAAAHPLGPCESTDDLTNALNSRWREMEWGYAELSDEQAFLRIVHYAAPLRALGAGHLGWSAAFLQGAYQGWFDSVGAAGLRVTQDVVPQDDARIELRIARAPR
ncbi:MULTISPECIES: cellulose biosynthesis protein BcsD [Burkholderia cepacia complex]|uniref:cellulose biosynthesis protein BcsD n=1 Tax=Burkholderia cepacia complex TaxID=87882 RepID=UPI001CF4D3ED|nr:cellulose biosynthesis protein BcsD [Burkholderia vietnamiensis]MCA8142930.1 cellulose synthase [Burkholderia multivorans]MCA8291149.1 cellulose synthase [Burkholderia vietnamiensis]WVN04637.1 cellulose biosynthesis protein BcsD [Burkholderia multivorans]